MIIHDYPRDIDPIFSFTYFYLILLIYFLTILQILWHTLAWFYFFKVF